MLLCLWRPVTSRLAHKNEEISLNGYRKRDAIQSSEKETEVVWSLWEWKKNDVQEKFTNENPHGEEEVDQREHGIKW